MLEELNLQRRSFESFIEEFPMEINGEYIIKKLEEVVSEKDKILLELLISLCYNAGFVMESCLLFCEILKGNWHQQHEEIARIFQFKLKCDCSVESLVEAMNQKYEYLQTSGDYESFVRKCMYAIADLKTPHSLNILNKLSFSKNLVIREFAMYQVKRITTSQD